MLTFLVNPTNTLQFLIIAELLWITLFFIALLIGFLNNDLNVISLTFFFLVFSAIELSIGLILILAQNLILRSITILDLNSNYLLFASRLKNRLFINKINWKLFY